MRVGTQGITRVVINLAFATVALICSKKLFETFCFPIAIDLKLTYETILLKK